MAEDGKTTEDDVLDAFFGSARFSPPRPDADFLARLSSDMEVMLPISKPAAAPALRNGDWDLFARFRSAFAASGLTGAAALGVWIGFVMPETLNDIAGYQYTGDGLAIGSFLPAADLAALDE